MKTIVNVMLQYCWIVCLCVRRDLIKINLHSFRPSLGYIILCCQDLYFTYVEVLKGGQGYATTKCFVYKQYGHTYVKCVTNPTKAKQFKANRINKRKDKILFEYELGMEWLVKITKSFNFSTLSKQYGSFIKRTLDVINKEDEGKTQVKEIMQAFKT